MNQRLLMSILTGWLLAFFGPVAISAQEGFRIVCGPYLQNVSEKEATVMWITNRNAVSWVEIAPDDGMNFYAEARPQFYQTNFGKKLIGTVHAVRVTGLQKGTSYRYRIYSKEVIEETPYFVQYGKVAATDVYTRRPYRFTTLDYARPATSFAVVNDIHADHETFSALMETQKDKKLDFVVFNGDMLSNMSSEEQLIEGFLGQAVRLFAAETPVFYARGNHETRGLFSPQYIRYFPTSTGQPYYAFRQGPAFFIVLDGGEDKPDNDIEYHDLAAFDAYRAAEVDWLREVVNSEAFKEAPVKIAIMHVPPVGSTWHGPLEVKKHFMPILNKAGIRVMLCAHLHQYTYIAPGEEGNDFPILINSHKHILEIDVNGQDIRIQIKDTEGKIFKTFNF